MACPAQTFQDAPCRPPAGLCSVMRSPLPPKPVVYHLRGQHPDTAVTVLRVVPRKEIPAKGQCVLHGSESIREIRTILQRFKLTLRIGVIVRYVRSAVRFIDPQRDQQLGRALGDHGGAPIPVKRQLARAYPLFPTSLPDQLMGQSRRFSVGHHPAYDIPTENVQDHIEIKVNPFDRAPQLRNVPGPHLVGAFSQQLRLLILRVSELIRSLFDLLVVCQDPVHGPLRAQVATLVQQGRPYLCWRLVHKTITVQKVRHCLPSGIRKGSK